METEETQLWFENDNSEELGYSFKEYDVTSTPNDFNSKTIIDFIESGLFKIPGFQRNYVWDIKRASKLIESIIIGLPIPQVFLYEEGKNSYLVVDGQQRLLTIFFFYKKRFPRKEKRFELRQIFDENGHFPDEVLHNDVYFEDFKLNLNDRSQSQSNKLHGLNYSTLGDFKTSFDLRTVRNIMIKQNFPDDDDSAMFEIFNRLNSGGVILKPQEIRTSLYHSNFYNHLYKLNLYENWRKLLNKSTPDLHMKDVEILLRGFAMLIDHKDYRPSMTRFLNQFSKKSKTYSEETLSFFSDLFELFCNQIYEINPSAFISKSGKFSITIFESIFVALCDDALKNKKTEIKSINYDKIEELKENQDFQTASQDNTAGKANVETRLSLAKKILE
ncbi:DUF262 domain-containing protein [Flavobacterium alkalisoli]|uniref:DUF262 domain-containing protein n=1 Tax=Flavobacterium alkalisoli TaxID=2602769 RepID=UPI003A8EA877